MEEIIINLFAYDEKLLFNQIKNKLKIRSNKLTYWLKKLVKEQIIKKEGRIYSLSESAEHLVPYLSKNKSLLPVVLIQIGDTKETFLTERTKRPYKGLLALPGGRVLIGESPQQAARRIMQTKYNLSITKPKIKEIAIEHIKKKKNVLYSFILLVVQATTNLPYKGINVVRNKKKVIPSDYQLIISKPRDLRVKTIISKT